MAQGRLFIHNFIFFFSDAFHGLKKPWHKKTKNLITKTSVAFSLALLFLATLSVEKKTSPTLRAAQYVSGIGFFASVVIFKDEFNLRGSSIAATSWDSKAKSIFWGYVILLLAIGFRHRTLFFNKTFFQRDKSCPIYRITIHSRGKYETLMQYFLSKTAGKHDLLLRPVKSQNIPKTTQELSKAKGNANLPMGILAGQFVKLHQIPKTSWQIGKQKTKEFGGLPC